MPSRHSIRAIKRRRPRWAQAPPDVFFSVALPQARRGFLNAAVLSFAHTLGEFGVVLMVGGNIPGETRTISIAIYDHVETLEYGSAHALSLLLLAFAFARCSLCSRPTVARRRDGRVHEHALSDHARWL